MVDMAGDERPPRPIRNSTRRLAVVITALLLVGLATSGSYLWWTATGPLDELRPGWTAVVTLLAGDGVAGSRDGPADDARFSDPFGVVAGPDGAIYIADAGDSPRIRRIGPDGRVSTVAGGERGFV